MPLPLNEVRVAIAGLGLMGGSLGLALRGSVGEVSGIEVDPAAAREALSRGAASRVVRPAEGRKAVSGCHLLVLAQPAGEMAPAMEQLADHLPAGCIVTDLAGAKMAVIEELADLLPSDVTYVPGHPLAGSEQQGIQGAREDLYRGAVWALTEEPPPLLSRVIRSAGATPLVVDAREHDRALARTSHLPHLMAHVTAAVAKDLACAGEIPLKDLSGSGFADTTRVAAGSPAAAADMCLYNRVRLLEALREASDALDELTDILQRGDSQQLRGRLGEVALWLRGWGGEGQCE